MGEVTVPIKNTELLNALNAPSKGNWVKVYEAGLQNGVKTETHFFRNNTKNIELRKSNCILIKKLCRHAGLFTLPIPEPQSIL